MCASATSVVRHPALTTIFSGGDVVVSVLDPPPAALANLQWMCHNL